MTMQGRIEETMGILEGVQALLDRAKSGDEEALFEGWREMATAAGEISPYVFRYLREHYSPAVAAVFKTWDFTEASVS